jgi:hypothetical protein
MVYTGLCDVHINIKEKYFSMMAQLKWMLTKFNKLKKLPPDGGIKISYLI